MLAHYPNLRETPDADPRTRTEWNVRDSDATLAFMPANALSPGTAFTIESAKRSRKPVLVVDPFAANAADGMRAFVAAHPAVRTLNIAGPRESESPGVYAAVYSILTEFVMVGE